MTSTLTLLEAFHTADPDGGVRVSAEQASRFAKDVAGDHNPLHDVDARRFCVPGDLLCALVLDRYGLSRRMQFTFRDMVGAGQVLYFPETDDGDIAVCDPDGNVCLEVQRSGAVCRDTATVEGFLREYVAFSGRTFPHYLIPVLEEKGVMFNPDRPLVIYDSMGFELDGFGFDRPGLELAGAELGIEGKRGNATLRFDIHADTGRIGAGWKQLVISGLRDYDDERMRRCVESFDRLKAAYEAGREDTGTG